jgi:hypothetical protein
VQEHQNHNEDPQLFWLRSIDQRLEGVVGKLGVLAETTVKKTDCVACQGRYVDKWYFIGWGSCFVLMSGVFMLVAKWNDVTNLFH